MLFRSIRLGDLFRSNYSKFALARLFGAGRGTKSETDTNNLNINGQSFMTQDAKKFDIEYNKILSKINAQGNTYFNKDTVYTVDKYYTSNLIDFNDVNDYNAFKLQIDNIGTDHLPIKRVGEVWKLTDTRIDTHAWGNPKLKDFITNWKDKVKLLLYPEYIHVSPYEAYIGAKTTTGGGPFDKFHDFMDEKNNSIVHSFKTAGGRGLAGVIESMNFDWYYGVWETDLGKKAPKMCKVNISFSPIHDITPGLDVNGYNRAPIYPVGRSDGESFKQREQVLSAEEIQKKIGI